MRAMRKRSSLAASFVVTVAAVGAVASAAGCDDKPKYATNPPDSTAAGVPTGAVTTSPTETTPATGASDTPPTRRPPIGNPPPILPSASSDSTPPRRGPIANPPRFRPDDGGTP